MSKEFYIWSWEHDAWWAENSRGYTLSKTNAGKYSFEEAYKICAGANYGFNKGTQRMPNEGMVPVEDIKYHHD